MYLLESFQVFEVKAPCQLDEALFPDFSKSILKDPQETYQYTNHVVFDILLFEVWIVDETL